MSIKAPSKLLRKRCFMWCGRKYCECSSQQKPWTGESEQKINMVRAKFKVDSNEPNGATNPEDKGSTVTLSPVFGGSEENESFYKWTPGGSIMLSTINEAAAKQFEVGKEFYVDFSPAQ